MCRAANEPGGPRRCPNSDCRPRFRSKADNRARKQISRYKQQIAQLEAANPALQQVICAQAAITDPNSDVIKQLRADRSRARRAGDEGAVQIVEAQLAAAQLAVAEQRLAEARAKAKPETKPNVATPHAAPAPWPTTTGALTEPPAAAVLQDAIYATGASVPKGDWMPLSKLRSMMPADASREDVDAMLKQLSRDGKIHLAPDPRKDGISQADHDSALRLGGEANHLVSWEAEARVRPEAVPNVAPMRRPSPAPRNAGQLEDAIKAAATHVHASEWMPLSQLRSMMPADASREDVDAMLKQLSRDGKVVLAPDPDRKSLQQADRENAVRIGGDENHLIAFTSWATASSGPKTDPDAALQRILANGVTAATPQEDLEAARRASGVTQEVGQAITKERFRREQAAQRPDESIRSNSPERDQTPSRGTEPSKAAPARKVPAAGWQTTGRSGGIGPVTGDGNLVMDSPQGPVHISMSGRGSGPDIVDGPEPASTQQHRPSKGDPKQPTSRRPSKKAEPTPRKARQRTDNTNHAQTGRTDRRPINVTGDGNITVTGVRASQARPQSEPSTVHEAIRAAYAAGVTDMRGDMQRLAEVRARISPRFSRDEVDQALREMGRSQVAWLAPNPNRKTRTDEDRTAAIHIGGDENDLISFYEDED